MIDKEDSQLAALAKAGDWGAFERLVSLYGDRVFGFAFFYSRNREDARDISQEVFFRLHKMIGRYDPQRPFFGWFYTLFLNVTRDFLGRRKRHVPLDENFCEAVSWNGAEDITSEEKAALFEAMGRLEDDDRTVLLMRYFQGMEPGEIAANLGITENLAGVRMHRARERLKKELEGLEHG